MVSHTTEPMSLTPNRHFHKFTLPKWETQHNLTCTNISIIDTAGASTSADRRSSREDDDDEGVANVREKLMHEATRMKSPNLRKESDDDAETLKPWFVRRGRQKRVMKAPITASQVRNDGVVARDDDLVSSRLRSIVDSNKIERPKFCIPISRKEKEEDFLTFLGRAPRQRPIKRPKKVQKQINVFPGLWLREVTAEMYEVHDTNQNGRFGKRKMRGKGF
ncbi:hypothetical protein MtrunA17_Chr5g0423281 [Medicago truncatula]|uniref:DUF1639 family protein n=1 Tax=Medicago truncatula TaxID=3880 RepID=A0A396HTR6_MEDTR|nr:hypothetical protein MtrunA17_Chr5g0423281 [Medicago truncatula]